MVHQMHLVFTMRRIRESSSVLAGIGEGMGNSCIRHCDQVSSCSSGEYAYASSVTTGISSKLCSGVGEGVCHSSPFACHGLGPAQE
jgi:hypothetical protein